MKSLIKKTLYNSGYYSLKKIINRPSEPRLIIVMLHNLIEHETDRKNATNSADPTPEQFEAQVKTIKKNYRLITVEDAMSEIKNNGRLSEPSVAITFDDGYLSNYKIAMPILKKYNASATIYLPTKYIDGDMSFWWIRTANAVKNLQKNDLTQDKINELTGYDIKHMNDNDSEDKKRDVIRHELLEKLRKLPTIEITTILDKMESYLQIDSVCHPEDTLPMSWTQIKEMADEGFEFGAHTVTHPNLKHLSVEESMNEITSSITEIKNKSGIDVKGIAFPYGKDIKIYKKLMDDLNKLSLLYSVTAVDGINDSTTNNHLLKRIVLPLSTSPSIIGRILDLSYLT